MEYTHLGRTGLTVSRLCLGTMNFGPQTTEADSHAIMDAAHENGINFFDTANVYGRRRGQGRAPRRSSATGSPRAAAAARRTVLATKLYGDMGDWPNEGKLSALNIRRALDASLTRLQTDYIDLYQFHHVDRRHAVGRDLAGHGGRRRAGQDPLRRQQQLRRLAHRHGAGRGRSPAQLHRPGQRAVDLQPAHPRRRARGAARPPSTTASASSRGRRCTAACSAGCCARSARASAGSRAASAETLDDAPRRRSRRTRTSRPNSATSPATSRSPGCCTSPP